MTFDTEITVDGPTLTGPWRSPAQMLQDQVVDGHTSVHDDATAERLGLAGAPIEAPTHFSQIDPLAVRAFGPDWFARGAVSCHFRTMVVEGEQVQASLTATAPTMATVEAHKADGTPVLTGTASLGPDHGDTALRARLSDMAARDPGELFVVDRLYVGMRSDEPEVVTMTRHERNGQLYPFSLEEKLARITEPHPWYTAEGGPASPWGRAIVPFEMISVLAHRRDPGWPVRSPAFGLFLDLEIALVGGPVFVDQPYGLEREVVALGQSRRTESYWTRTTLCDPSTGDPVAIVLLHSGVFKESYPGYPVDRRA